MNRPTLPPLDMEAWSRLSREDPASATQALIQGLEALPEGQGKAVVAARMDSRTLEANFEKAHACGGPLAGIPYALKDLFDLKGLPTGAGSSFLGEISGPAPSDSRLVGALSSRGALCAFKTQMHEFAYGLTGENPFYGNVDNPASPGCTTGGSSSGSAAAVAAGLVPFSIGTDTGGSVRIPASFCGLYGYKMTPGHPWISDAFPLAPSCDSAGWFARTAGDLLRLNRSLLGTLSKASKRRLVGAFLCHGSLEPEIKTAFVEQAEGLAPSCDAETSGLLRHAFENLALCYSVLTSMEAAQIHKDWLHKRASDYSPAVLARIRRGLDWPESVVLQAAAARSHLRSTLASYFLEYDFLVLPASPCGPLAHGSCADFDRNRILELTAPASLAGLPVLSLPCFDSKGLPFGGLQVLLPSLESPVPELLLQGAGA